MRGQGRILPGQPEQEIDSLSALPALLGLGVEAGSNLSRCLIANIWNWRARFSVAVATAGYIWRLRVLHRRTDRRLPHRDPRILARRRSWLRHLLQLSKMEMLGVPADLVMSHGAVSEEVARAMAEGALAEAGVDITVAVTGVAGPDGGTRRSGRAGPHRCGTGGRDNSRAAHVHGRPRKSARERRSSAPATGAAARLMRRFPAGLPYARGADRSRRVGRRGVRRR